jgi:hypothetical protein
MPGRDPPPSSFSSWGDGGGQNTGFDFGPLWTEIETGEVGFSFGPKWTETQNRRQTFLNSSHFATKSKLAKVDLNSNHFGSKSDFRNELIFNRGALVMPTYDDLQQAFLACRREQGIAKAHELIRSFKAASLDEVDEDDWDSLIAAFKGTPQSFEEIAPRAYSRWNAPKKRAPEP